MSSSRGTRRGKSVGTGRLARLIQRTLTGAPLPTVPDDAGASSSMSGGPVPLQITTAPPPPATPAEQQDPPAGAPSHTQADGSPAPVFPHDGEDEDVDWDPSDHRERIVFMDDGRTMNKSCGGNIHKHFEERLHPEGYCWTAVPAERKALYWGQFKKDYRWRPEQEPQVYASWKERAQRVYKDFVHRARDKGKNGEKPPGIPDDVWQGWRAVWATEDGQARSERGSVNRRGGNAEAPVLATHSGGSVNQLVTARRVSEARGEPVDKYEVYKYTHTKHHDGVTWLNDRAREASESYLRRQEEALRNGEQFDSNSALYDALGGHDKRQKVFGMGAMANLWERPVRRGKSAASSSSSMTQEEADSLKLHVVGLTEQLESANSRVGSLEIELQGTRHELEGAKRHMEERFRMMEAMMAQAGIFNMPASTSRTSPESSAPDTSTPTLPPRPPPHPDPDTQDDQDL